MSLKIRKKVDSFHHHLAVFYSRQINYKAKRVVAFYNKRIIEMLQKNESSYLKENRPMC